MGHHYWSCGAVWFSLISLLAWLHPVTAWGKDGHVIVANLAWRLLSNATRSSLTDILSISAYGIDADCTEACSPLAQIADWADAARYTRAYHWTAPLHYIDVRQEPCPIRTRRHSGTECYFNYTRDCPDDMCVAGAIVNDTRAVMRGNAAGAGPTEAQRTSLMFLIHFVGDIHQPLHCSRAADKGGNDIHVSFEDHRRRILRGRRQEEAAATPPRAASDARRLKIERPRTQGNLHSFWDSVMIEKTMRDDYGGSRAAFEDSLWSRLLGASPRQWSQWLRCSDGTRRACATHWGQESLGYALTYAYRNVNNTEILDGTVLTLEYYTSRVKIVEERLVLGGVRLASTLEMIMSNELAPTQIMNPMRIATLQQ